MHKQILFGVIMGVALISLGTNNAFADMYVKVGDISGDSAYLNESWIDILSFSFEVDKPTSALASGYTKQSSHATFSDISIVKQLDSSSPKLLEAVTDGELFKEVKLHLKNNLSKDPYLEIILVDAQVSGYSINGASAGGVPTEAISLNFKEIQFVYDKKNEDGISEGKVVFSWNLEDGVK